MLTGESIALFAAPLSADGNGPQFRSHGGAVVLTIASGASLGGGTVKVQYSTDEGVTWADVGQGLTTTTTGVIGGTTGFPRIPQGLYRGVLTGSTAPTGVQAWLSTVSS